MKITKRSEGTIIMKKILSILLCFILTGCVEIESIESGEQTIQQEMTKEEFIETCIQCTYDDLARYPDKFKGKNIKVTGEVSMLQEFGKIISFCADITKDSFGFWTDSVIVTYRYNDGEGRILSGDIVDIYGTFKGLSGSVPEISAKYITLVKE